MEEEIKQQEEQQPIDGQVMVKPKTILVLFRQDCMNHFKWLYADESGQEWIDQHKDHILQILQVQKTY